MSIIRTTDVLNSDSKHFINEEFVHGNYGLLGLSKLAGIGGPFSLVSPWELEDEDGTQLIFAGGYGAMPFGNNHPDLVEFVKEYLEKSNDVSFTQHTVSKWRAALSKNLVDALAKVDPSHADSRVFYSNSGAESIETALKFVKFYRKEAKYIVNFTNSYHGKTYAALSLTPNATYQNPFKPLMPNVITVPYNDAYVFQEKVLELRAESIIAVVVEPIQGDAGVIAPSANFLETVGSVCKENGIPLIADEVLTGLGRTGYWFTSVEYGKMSPDIITLAKPLSGGMIPIGATIVRNEIFTNMLSGINSKIQSNTFGGGALAMAIGLRSLEIIEDQALVDRAAIFGERAKNRLSKLPAEFPELIKSVHIEGMLWGIHFQSVPGMNESASPQVSVSQMIGLASIVGLHKAGVMSVSSLGKNPHVRLMPALNMPDEIFEELLNRIENFARENQSSANLLARNAEVLQGLMQAV
jgi:putrescine aminotransferase